MNLSIRTMLSLVQNRQNIQLIVEEKQLMNGKKRYHLKRRIHNKVFKKKFEDYYERNFNGDKIIFKSFKEIEVYIKLMFSEPEGFIQSVIDLQA